MVGKRELFDGVQIRAYLPPDYPDVKRNLEEGELFDPIWDSEGHLLGKSQERSESILVAVADGKIVGNIFVIFDRWGPFIFHLAVRREYRGRGIGSRLLEKAENLLTTEGFEEVAIFMNAEDPELEGYYNKRGYTTSGIFKCGVKTLNLPAKF